MCAKFRFLWGLSVGVWDFGFRIQGSGRRVQGAGRRVQDLGYVARTGSAEGPVLLCTRGVGGFCAQGVGVIGSSASPYTLQYPLPSEAGTTKKG